MERRASIYLPPPPQKMSRKDREDALMRLEIVKAKKNNTFIDRRVVYVLWDEETGIERAVYLPFKRYFDFLSKQ